MFVVKFINMTFKNIVVVLTLLTCSLSYWLYCPVPDGYSTKSSAKLSLILSTFKLTDILAKAGNVAGLGSYAQINRGISTFLIGLLDKKGSDPDVKETDSVFDGVPVRIYEPAGRSGVLPGFVFYHGGGYMIGNIDGYADTTRRLCKQTNTVVVSVEYRLAPEHLFPAAFEDCVTATKYFLKNAAQFKVNPKRVAIGGDSAGGNLAATVSLKLRDDEFKPANKLQILVYPHVQSLDFQLPSMMQNADGPILTRRAMTMFCSTYLEGNTDKEDLMLNNDHVSLEVKKKGLPFLDLSKLPEKFLRGYVKPSVESGNETAWNELKSRLLNPYFAPLAAARLDKLPPAYIFTAEFDPLRDEAFLYAARLRESGVKVTHSHSDIGFHGIISVAQFVEEAEAVFRDMTKFIVDNL